MSQCAGFVHSVQWEARLSVLIREATLSFQGSASLLPPACAVDAVLLHLLMLRKKIVSKLVCSRFNGAGCRGRLSPQLDCLLLQEHLMSRLSCLLLIQCLQPQVPCASPCSWRGSCAGRSVGHTESAERMQSASPQCFLCLRGCRNSPVCWFVKHSWDQTYGL